MSEFSLSSETCHMTQIMENSLEKVKENLAYLLEVLAAVSLSQEVECRKLIMRI